MNLLLMLLSLIVFRIPGRVCQSDYEICRQPFQCGDQTDIPYPFYGGDRPVSCGFPGFEMSCQEGVPLINTSQIIYRVRHINNQTQTLTVARNDLWINTCSPQLFNTSVNPTFYTLYAAANDQEITLVYGCSGQTQVPQPNQFSCDGNGEINGLAYFTTIALAVLPNISITCNGPQITVPLNQTGVALLAANPSSLRTSLQTGFSIQWSEDNQNCESCLGSGGACGSNPSGSFACHCANGTFESTCSNAPNQNDKKQNRRTIIVTTVVLGSILVAVCAYFLLKLLFKYRARKHKSRLLFFNTKEIDTGYSEERAFKHDKHAVQLEELPIFTFMMLSNATDNFDRANKLGQGGFGSVYKGRLQNGVEIAVKRLARSSNQGVDEFMNEVEVISRLQHRNLVRLLGCCVEIEEKLLVYEYMPNGSLDAYLFGSLKHDFLDWERRKLIIEGICRGLLYLHRDSRLKIIHRDLKPSNILLDEELNPKISDFGMARIFGGKDDEANTTRVVGTFGYMSPEYAHRGIFSEKSDVYSFGVLLIEIVSGKKNSSFYDEDQQLFLTACAWKLWNEGRIVKLIDPAIYDRRMEDDILRYANVGLLCVQEMAADRPNASTVLSMLSREIVELPHPKQPAFLGMQSFQSIESSSNKCSVNGVTFSTVDQGR